jgi:hypothetical protein
MALQGDQVALYLSGADVPIPECNIIIHQPSIKDICLFKETNFLTAATLLSHFHDNAEKLRKERPELSEYGDVTLVLAAIQQDPELCSNVTNFFQLVFPRYSIDILENEIFFTEGDKRVGLLATHNYSSFEQVIKDLFLIPTKGDSYNPQGKRAAAIAEKLKEREKILAQKKGLNKKVPPSLFGSYASILSIGMNIDINTIYNYTPFQLYDAFNRYWKKVSNDFYTKVSTTPMMDTSKMEEPESWSENIYD